MEELFNSADEQIKDELNKWVDENLEYLVQIAKTTFYINRVVDGYEGLTVPNWEDLSIDTVESLVSQIVTIMNFPDLSLAEWHMIDVQRMKDLGWVKGEKIDFDKKESPYICDYESLPKLKRIKDALFFETIRSFITGRNISHDVKELRELFKERNKD